MRRTGTSFNAEFNLHASFPCSTLNLFHSCLLVQFCSFLHSHLHSSFLHYQSYRSIFIPLIYAAVEGGSVMALTEVLAFEEEVTAAEDLLLLLSMKREKRF